MRYLLLISLICSLSACDQKPGPDSLSSHEFGQQGTGNCSCHGAAIGSRRQVLGAGGDFASNPSVTSHHVQGGADPTSSQCLVCHDLSLHTQGTVLLRHADTGSVIAYAAPSTLEQFCTGCHDADGALATAVSASTPLSPFGDGATLGAAPYAAGITIASAWSGSSTHRSQGLTCAGTGAAGTGCHGRSGAVNAHGSVNKGLLTNSMNFQIPSVLYSVYSASPLGSSYQYSNYQLCFDCHESTAYTKDVVLGYLAGGVYDTGRAPTPFFTAGIQSVFREHYDPLQTLVYNDTMWGDTYLALHNYHLLGFQVNVLVDPTQNMLQWKYRGDPAMTGRITCTACHAVHGTAVATARSTYPELDLQTFTGVGADRYTSIATFISSTIMTSPPMNCAIDCHGVAGQTSYWHTPAGL